MAADRSGHNPSDSDADEPVALDADTITSLRDAALLAVTSADSVEELAHVRRQHAGDRSPLALANRRIGSLPPDQRKEVGQRVGAARREVSAALDGRTEELAQRAEAQRLAQETVDVTLPYDRDTVGSRHPLTMLQERIADAFVAMGWEVAEGPEAEAEWLNFDALNIGPDHPSRTMMDTFFLADPFQHQGADTDGHLVLRTHTSPVQARSMLSRSLPIYVICPGRTYRTDELDATHTPVFHQVEGLAVDRGLSMASLKGTLDHFAAAMFGDGVTTRFRPSYFPFTEPSAEMDLVCFVCRGREPDVVTCRTCKGEGWIEWGGCGVVNPRVLTACGVDPAEYSGFAFGMGVERTLMFRHGVEDMHDIVEGDVRFALAFGTEL